jgi:hypothetical protein
MPSDRGIKNGRYFLSALERSILVQTIEEYFQLPWLSQGRSGFLGAVARSLAEINPRWTKRAVRIWFNNNKHAYVKSQDN